MGHGDWSGQGSIVCFLVSLLEDCTIAHSWIEAGVLSFQGGCTSCAIYLENHSWTELARLRRCLSIGDDQLD